MSEMNPMIEQSEQYLIHSYNRYPVMLESGQDVYLYVTDGKKYLDFAVSPSAHSATATNRLRTP